MPGGAVHTATATKSTTAPQARVSTGAVWRHSQITWTGYRGGICIASRGCQRAGFPSAAALMTA